MKGIILGLIKRLLFWLLVFAMFRIVFLLYFQKLVTLAGVSLSEVLSVFWYAIPLDLSTACYLLSISYLLLMLANITNSRLFIKADRFFSLSILIIYSLISTSELGLYGEWNTKLSYKALSYLNNPTEIFNSISTSIFFFLIVVWLAQALLAYAFFRRFIEGQPTLVKHRGWSVLWTIVFVPLLLFLGIRGGLSEIPITTSTSYFSKHQILNLAAVNSGNNMLVSILNSYDLQNTNPFISMPDEEARQVIKEIHQMDGDSTQKLCTIAKPNIVIVLLESWSADLVESLGGEPGITPNFRKLEKGGLLFTNFFASGNRSQQAMGSLFGGLPGLPITTITDHPEKYAGLPSFVKDISKEGYHTSFWFGGQLNYGNILSYLRYNEFDKITEGKDLPADFVRGKLGVHDEYLFKYVALELNNQPTPFFTTIFTLSSHSPYDEPMEKTIHWPKTEKDYVNSAHYSDKALGDFFEVAKQQSWYDSTIFIILADHSHHSYRDHPVGSFEHHKIPMLIYGPILKPEYQGKVFDKIAGNTDIPATLLSQLDLSHSAYPWSKDLFNVYYKPMAFFECNEQGFGYKRPDGYVVWDILSQQFIQKDIPAEKEKEIVKQGNAYLQVLFEDFLSY